jgi:hypothetical protein
VRLIVINNQPLKRETAMPKTKKDVKVEVHDQTPIKDPKGGGHHGKKGKAPAEQTRPSDPPGMPIHYVP